MRREVFDSLAGFDETLRRLEDVDFGWRAAYAGLAVHYENPCHWPLNVTRATRAVPRPDVQVRGPVPALKSSPHGVGFVQQLRVCRNAQVLE